MPQSMSGSARATARDRGQTATDPLTIRPASGNDIEFLLPLIDSAADGLPSFLWKRFAAPGRDPMAWARARMMDPRSTISWERAFIAESGGTRAGCVFVRPVPIDPPEIDAHPGSLFLPLSELEAMAAGTGYVYVLAAAEGFAHRGVEAELLAFAESRFWGPRGMSAIPADNQMEMRALYERADYYEISRRPMLKEAWSSPGRNWILMIKH